MASSRVGESTSAKKGDGLSSSACRMGSAKAPVLPEPVCARPITSLPGGEVRGREGGGWRRARSGGEGAQCRTCERQRQRLHLNLGRRLPAQRGAGLHQLRAHAQLGKGGRRARGARLLLLLLHFLLLFPLHRAGTLKFPRMPAVSRESKARARARAKRPSRARWSRGVLREPCHVAPEERQSGAPVQARAQPARHAASGSTAAEPALGLPRSRRKPRHTAAQRRPAASATLSLGAPSRSLANPRPSPPAGTACARCSAGVCTARFSIQRCVRAGRPPAVPG